MCYKPLQTNVTFRKMVLFFITFSLKKEIISYLFLFCNKNQFEKAVEKLKLLEYFVLSF